VRIVTVSDAVQFMDEKKNDRFIARLSIRFGVDRSPPASSIIGEAHTMEYVSPLLLRDNAELIEPMIWANVQNQIPKVWDAARRQFYAELADKVDLLYPEEYKPTAPCERYGKIGMRREMWVGVIDREHLAIGNTPKAVGNAIGSGIWDENISILNPSQFRSLFGFIPKMEKQNIQRVVFDVEVPGDTTIGG
jgi:hypothetical protein